MQQPWAYSISHLARISAENQKTNTSRGTVCGMKVSHVNFIRDALQTVSESDS